MLQIVSCHQATKLEFVLFSVGVRNWIMSGEPDVISASDFITFNNKEIFPISKECSKKTFDYDIECYTCHVNVDH